MEETSWIQDRLKEVHSIRPIVQQEKPIRRSCSVHHHHKRTSTGSGLYYNLRTTTCDKNCWRWEFTKGGHKQSTSPYWWAYWGVCCTYLLPPVLPPWVLDNPEGLFSVQVFGGWGKGGSSVYMKTYILVYGWFLKQHHYNTISCQFCNQSVFSEFWEFHNTDSLIYHHKELCQRNALHWSPPFSVSSCVQLFLTMDTLTKKSRYKIQITAVIYFIRKRDVDGENKYVAFIKYVWWWEIIPCMFFLCANALCILSFSSHLVHILHALVACFLGGFILLVCIHSLP